MHDQHHSDREGVLKESTTQGGILMYQRGAGAVEHEIRCGHAGAHVRRGEHPLQPRLLRQRRRQRQPHAATLLSYGELSVR